MIDKTQVAAMLQQMANEREERVMASLPQSVREMVERARKEREEVLTAFQRAFAASSEIEAQEYASFVITRLARVVEENRLAAKAMVRAHELDPGPMMFPVGGEP
jgi:DNA-binding transcriptional MocR family regulator